MALKSYRDLDTWKASMDLVDAAFDLSEELPPAQRFILVSQLQRASLSIPANIAEGYGRTHRGDYKHHLSIALGSLREVETLLLVCVRRKFVSRDRMKPVWELADKTRRLLSRLKQSLDND